MLLPADQCQQDNCSVCRWLADWCNAPCGGFSDTDGAVVPICRYALRFPPAISGKADNSRLVTHTKSRSSRYRCTCPLYVPPNKNFASKSSSLSAKYCVLKFCPHLGSLMFYTITNLQGSQTLSILAVPQFGFYTITNLQGSQTVVHVEAWFFQFYTITNLQGSQTICSYRCSCPLFYTITNLQGSQTSTKKFKSRVLFYTITNLQGSQTISAIIMLVFQFYTITNLQGSQTNIRQTLTLITFYTITNLQGSQTT